MSFYLTGTQLAPLNLSRIGYRNALRATNASVTASSTDTGFDPQSVKNAQTFDRWRAGSASASLTCTFPSRQVQYVAITGHNFAEASGNVTITLTVGGQQVFSGAVNKNSSALYFEVNNITASAVVIQFSGFVVEIGSVFIGQSLIMQRPIYGGHSPVDLSRITDRTVNLSETGELLGGYVRNVGLQTQFNWQNLEADWYRANFDTFAQYIARSSAAAFVIAWRPGDAPDAVAYAWALGNPQPSNMGVRDLMEVTLSVRGHLSLGTEPRFD